MSDRKVTWPCGEVPFSETIRAAFYGSRLSDELLLWGALVVLPITVWTLRTVLSEGPLVPAARTTFATAAILFVALMWALGRRFVWGDLSRFLRRGDAATAQWRKNFEEARVKTAELGALVPLADRSRDSFVRSLASTATASKLRYVYSLSRPADVSFSPRHFAGGALQSGRLREVLLRQLVLELVRLGGNPVVFGDRDEELIAIWQLDEVVQFWCVLKVEPFGAELRVSEKTGYQWWVPWTARSRILGLPVERRFHNVTKALWDEREIPWHLSGFPSPPLAAPACAIAALLFPPIGIAYWAWHAFSEARTRKRFAHWHDPDYGDALDLALLQNERSLLPLRYMRWTVDNIVNEDGTPSYPDILQRIETMRELVGAAVTQALEETINSWLPVA